jgi:shikimate dehydrogenase
VTGPVLRLAVVGDPISHSRSPDIHRAALGAVGIEGSYDALRVDSDGMSQIVEDIRRGALDGVNVTMPHKGVAAALVDDLSQDARRARSVNTIVRHPDGTLVGHSTDVTALRRLWPVDTPAPALVLGAGGAAAAACLAAGQRTVYVSARRPEAVTHLRHQLEMDLVRVPWGTAVVGAIVVNATPVGMADDELEPRIVELAGAVIDLAYGPEETGTITLARSLGLAAVDGLEVLVAQAADAFRLWTGRDAPVDVMVEALRNSSRETRLTPNQS